MADEDESLPHPGLAEAERRVRSAIQGARAQGESAVLALRHAELGMILSAQMRHPDAVSEYRASLGYLSLLRADGTHEEQRLTRAASLSAPPPGPHDFDLDRLEAEVRVALVEALLSAGDPAAAAAELQPARAMAKGFFRRRLRKRLDRAAASVAAAGVPDSTTAVADLRRHLAQVSEPAQQRALGLRIANRLLDDGQLDAAVRESLLLVRAADEAGDATVRAGARQVLGLALEGLGRRTEALPILSDAFRDLHGNSDSAGMVGMGEALAHRLLDAGDAAGAATVLRATQQAARSSGDGAVEVSSATMLGVVLDAAGDRRAAAEALTEAAARAQYYGQPTGRADALHSCAVVLGRAAGADNLVEALSMLQEAHRIYAEESMPDRVAGCDHEAAALLARHGSYDAAAVRYRSALAAYEALPPAARDTGDWPDEVADCRANLGWLSGPRDAPAQTLFRSGGHTMTHRPSDG